MGEYSDLSGKYSEFPAQFAVPESGLFIAIRVK